MQLEALNHDLYMAARIQQKILHQEFPVFPDDERFDIFANMIAAKHVGGDFYDFFKFDDDRIAFFYGLINLKTGALSYCNGGHYLPYIQSQDGSVIEFENVEGLLLG